MVFYYDNIEDYISSWTSTLGRADSQYVSPEFIFMLRRNSRIHKASFDSLNVFIFLDNNIYFTMQ